MLLWKKKVSGKYNIRCYFCDFLVFRLYKNELSIENFRASWKTEPLSCGGNLRATTQPQILTSPGYPQNYPGGLECLYTISAQPGRIITLEVINLYMYNYNVYVRIKKFRKFICYNSVYEFFFLFLYFILPFYVIQSSQN